MKACIRANLEASGNTFFRWKSHGFNRVEGANLVRYLETFANHIDIPISFANAEEAAEAVPCPTDSEYRGD